jgi:hypothetical protein
MRLFGFEENDLRKQYSFPTPPDGGGFLGWIDGVDWIDRAHRERGIDDCRVMIVDF